MRLGMMMVNLEYSRRHPTQHTTHKPKIGLRKHNLVPVFFLSFVLTGWTVNGSNGFHYWKGFPFGSYWADGWLAWACALFRLSMISLAVDGLLLRSTVTATSWAFWKRIIPLRLDLCILFLSFVFYHYYYR
ncbi:hypothetical protein V8C43DRAFT_280498 [Trichoderma afarasin]